MRWYLVFCSILFLSGCCGSEVVLRKVEIKSPRLIDTVEAEKFKLKSISFSHFDSAQYDKDSLEEEIGYRGISFKEGSRDTAAIAEFFPALNKFVIKIPERVDTVLIRDTIRVKPTDIILLGNDNTERLIWIISFALTSLFIIIYKGYLNVRKSKK